MWSYPGRTSVFPSGKWRQGALLKPQLQLKARNTETLPVSSDTLKCKEGCSYSMGYNRLFSAWTSSSCDRTFTFFTESWHLSCKCNLCLACKARNMFTSTTARPTQYRGNKLNIQIWEVFSCLCLEDDHFAALTHLSPFLKIHEIDFTICRSLHCHYHIVWGNSRGGVSQARLSCASRQFPDTENSCESYNRWVLPQQFISWKSSLLHLSQSTNKTKNLNTEIKVKNPS